MIICPYGFDRPDPEDPTYSMEEVDYYAHTPRKFHTQVPNHRLSLRKNLVTGKYEVYRQYVDTVAAQAVLAGQSITIITTEDRRLEEVAVETGDLKEAVDFANGEANRYHGGGSWMDTVCNGTRTPALGCPVTPCPLRGK